MDCASDTTPRDRRHLRRVYLLTLVYGLVLLGTTLLVAKDIVSGGPMGWLAAAAPTIMAGFVALAFARFIRHADELTRLLQLRALAIGLAAGFVAFPASFLLDRQGISLHPFPVLYLLVTVVYVIAFVLSRRRYR